MMMTMMTTRPIQRRWVNLKVGGTCKARNAGKIFVVPSTLCLSLLLLLLLDIFAKLNYQSSTIVQLAGLQLNSLSIPFTPTLPPFPHLSQSPNYTAGDLEILPNL